MEIFVKVWMKQKPFSIIFGEIEATGSKHFTTKG